MKRILFALALASGPALAASVPALTLANLKGPVARICRTEQAKTIAQLWQQLTACPSIASPTPTPTPSPSPAPTPTPTPTPAPTDGLPVLNQLPSIPSNFDTAAEIVAADIPPSMAPDNVGAFRFLCKPSHLAYDDPIVYPGQPGASHLHQFFGNTLADANSTYALLRTSGDSTCHSKLNRSAYWIPAMMNGRGQVVLPDVLAIYYKRFPAGSAMCQQVGICIPMPRGLRMVFGRKMTGETPANIFEGIAIHFDCQGTGAVGGHYPTLAEAASHCPIGAQLGAVNNAPFCWNGQLDSADHRSHMAYYIQDAQGLVRCPADHPYVVPFFTLSAWYTTDGTLDRSGSTDPNLQTWYFSSDRMPGMANKVPGATFHADWFGAWDDATLATWTANCIDRLLSCTTGNLGNGTAMKWPAGFSFTTVPNLVDVPAHP